MNTPMISVLMPVFNGEKYLREAIESILNQTYGDFEFIILNDGSTDGTESIILSYNDPRIIYVKNEVNLGIVKTLNKGIDLAKGKYIARMDADDISLPDRFEKQVAYLEEHQEIDICGGWMKIIGRTNSATMKYPITHNDIKAYMLFNSPISHPTIMAKKSFYNENKYRTNSDAAEDYDLWSRTIDSKKFYNLPTVLLMYRLHADQTTNAENSKQVYVANLVRKKMLSKIGIVPTHKEMELHTNLSLSKYSVNDMEMLQGWVNKIKDFNNVYKYFDEKSLKDAIGWYWLRVFNSSNEYDIKLLFRLISSPHYRFSKLKAKDHFKFYVKCLVGWKRK